MSPSDPGLTHMDERGRARMVDVGAKQETERVARAGARVRMSPESALAVQRADGPKGEVLATARLAGISAAKLTGQLIPLAHPLSLSFVDVEASVDVQAGVVELIAEARTRGRTGVEMEAMTACAVAALTVYDMVKGLERGVAIEEVVLLEKRGGRSDWARGEGADGAGTRTHTGGPPAHGEGRRAGGSPRAVAAVITVSTSKAAGEGRDESGPLLAALAERLGLEVEGAEVVTDDRAAIEARLRHWAGAGCALILTSGGTGLSASDVTPEATAAVIERDAPGIAEAVREISRPHTGNWMLSRGRAGVCGRTLIVNLPGSPRSIEQVGAELEGPLLHALGLLSGAPAPH